MILTVNLKNKYDITIEEGLMNNLKTKDAFMVTDKRVAELYPQILIQDKTVVIEGYEKSKNIQTYQHICNELIRKGIKRDSVLIALGGGVVGDITGFVAATLYRGIPFIMVPTTFLAQIDSSIGGKVGIDFCGAKNLIGAFYQPKAVYIDPLFLDTLTPREWLCGNGELLKYALIEDQSILEETNRAKLIYRALDIKRRYVEEDEYDQGKRKILNFGHTFGHAIEQKSQYAYSHGYAIALGMILAIKVGIKLDITKKETYDKVLDLYHRFQILIPSMNLKDYINLINMDKKSSEEKIDLILLEEINKPIIYSIALEELYEISTD